VNRAARQREPQAFNPVGVGGLGVLAADVDHVAEAVDLYAQLCFTTLVSQLGTLALPPVDAMVLLVYRPWHDLVPTMLGLGDESLQNA